MTFIISIGSHKHSCYWPNVYRISPPMSPGLIWVRKAFLMGLSVGGLIRREGEEGLYAVQKENETTDIKRQNKNLYLKKWRKCIVLFVYLLSKDNSYLKSYTSGSKIRINAFIRAVLCAGGLLRGVTQVLMKRWVYLGGDIYTGE